MQVPSANMKAILASVLQEASGDDVYCDGLIAHMFTHFQPKHDERQESSSM